MGDDMSQPPRTGDDDRPGGPDATPGPPPIVPATQEERLAVNPRNARVGWAIAGSTALLLLVLSALSPPAAAQVNRGAWAEAPKPVSVEPVQAGSFRPRRTYVGTLQPWASAKIGPQYVAAYV